jgi:8-oxo-dGTP diphosphatase
MVEANEPPLEAARREVKEELGLDARPVGLLCVDWVSPHGPWDDTLAFVFDGGVLRPGQIATIRLLDGEVATIRFCTEGEALTLLRPRLSKRVGVALQALRSGRAQYLQDGLPAA